ncbi:hypothetical protein [Microbacterium sp. NPDC056569]|uniref:hypothetical protein n=1 Tax=Microbacterium sp. NPDC056569 TaxID=3345867 RepID=UPI00366ED9E7
MTSQITALDEPTPFVDQQVRGRFKTFVHEHRFEQLPIGSRITDTIAVASPAFGSLVGRLVRVPYLRGSSPSATRIFSTRSAEPPAAAR